VLRAQGTTNHHLDRRPGKGSPGGEEKAKTAGFEAFCHSRPVGRGASTTAIRLDLSQLAGLAGAVGPASPGRLPVGSKSDAYLVDYTSLKITLEIRPILTSPPPSKFPASRWPITSYSDTPRPTRESVDPIFTRDGVWFPPSGAAHSRKPRPVNRLRTRPGRTLRQAPL